MVDFDKKPELSKDAEIITGEYDKYSDCIKTKKP